MTRSLVLTGYRGTGKSTIARLLSDRLALPLVSTDARIVEIAGRPIPEIVAAEGWPGFRARERDVVEALAAGGAKIIDTGGGAILDPRNRAALRRAGPVIWLTARIETIARRIHGDAGRPSLTGADPVEEIRSVLAEREPLYLDACDFLIATDDRAPETLAREIVARRF